MPKGSYGGSSMGLVRFGDKRGTKRKFGKREAKRYICNRCLNRFQAGESGRVTAYGAYRHVKCPPIGGGA